MQTIIYGLDIGIGGTISVGALWGFRQIIYKVSIAICYLSSNRPPTLIAVPLKTYGDNGCYCWCSGMLTLDPSSSASSTTIYTWSLLRHPMTRWSSETVPSQSMPVWRSFTITTVKPINAITITLTFIIKFTMMDPSVVGQLSVTFTLRLVLKSLKVMTHKSFLFRICFYTPKGPQKHV